LNVTNSQTPNQSFISWIWTLIHSWWKNITRYCTMALFVSQTHISAYAWFQYVIIWVH